MRAEHDVVDILLVGELDYERLYVLPEPDVPAEFVSVDSWHELYDFLDDRTDEADLVAAITARRGNLRWSDDLENPPAKLAEQPPATFVVAHPREGDPKYDRRFLRFE